MSAGDGNRGNVPQRFAKISEDGKFSLDVDVLRQILLNDKVEDMKVYVISIIGSLRSGKSFLMNLFVRYLQRRCRGENGFGDRSESVSGFEWKAGVEGVTKGMWIWPEVFPLETASGGKVGVVLVDTQGSFDKNSSKTEIALLFSVTALTSSVLIYNVHRGIDEKTLEHLVEFLTCMSDEFKPLYETKLQKCLFLVRDWEFVDNYATGIIEGNAYLNRTFNNYNESNENACYIRRYIQDMCKDITCFLMIHPGENASRIAFHGELAVLKDTFLDDVERLAAYLFEQENIKVDGRLTCKELFERYTSFRGKKITNMKDFLTITVDLKLAEISMAANFFYSTRFKPSGYLSKIVEEHEEIWKKTLEHFNKLTKDLKVDNMGRAETVRKKLRKDLAHSFFNTLVMLATMKYEDMLKKIKISATGSGHLKDLVEEIEKVKIVIESYMTQASSVGEPVQYSNAYTQLDEGMKPILEEKIHPEVLAEYSSQLQTALADPSMTVQDLSSTHKRILDGEHEILDKLSLSWMDEMFITWTKEMESMRNDVVYEYVTNYRKKTLKEETSRLRLLCGGFGNWKFQEVKKKVQQDLKRLLSDVPQKEFQKYNDRAVQVVREAYEDLPNSAQAVLLIADKTSQSVAASTGPYVGPVVGTVTGAAVLVATTPVAIVGTALNVLTLFKL